VTPGSFVPRATTIFFHPCSDNYITRIGLPLCVFAESLLGSVHCVQFIFFFSSFLLPTPNQVPTDRLPGRKKNLDCASLLFLPCLSSICSSLTNLVRHVPEIVDVGKVRPFPRDVAFFAVGRMTRGAVVQAVYFAWRFFLASCPVCPARKSK